MVTTLIILSVVFAVIAHTMAAVSGYAKMVCDLSEEEKLNFSPKEYWHKRISSVNKHQYKGKVKVWLVAIDSDYIYICIATDTWKRISLTTW